MYSMASTKRLDVEEGENALAFKEFEGGYFSCPLVNYEWLVAIEDIEPLMILQNTQEAAMFDCSEKNLHGEVRLRAFWMERGRLPMNKIYIL